MRINHFIHFFLFSAILRGYCRRNTKYTHIISSSIYYNARISLLSCCLAHIFWVTFLLNRNNFSWAWVHAPISWKWRYLLGYNIPFKGRNPRVLASRLDRGSLLLSFSSRLPVPRSLSLVQSEKSIQGGFACIFIVLVLCAGCSSSSSASSPPPPPPPSRLSLTLTSTMSREYERAKWKREEKAQGRTMIN